MGAWSSCIMRARACAPAALILTHHPRPLRGSDRPENLDGSGLTHRTCPIFTVPHARQISPALGQAAANDTNVRLRAAGVVHYYRTELLIPSGWSTSVLSAGSECIPP